MTLKTYLFPEVAGHGEITEWVPADVARELLEALEKSKSIAENCQRQARDAFMYEHFASSVEQSEKAIKKSCGEL